MLYEPVVLLRKLGPQEVKQLIEQNSCPSKINDQPNMGNYVSNRNVQKCPKCCQGNDTKPVQKIIISNNSLPTAENQQQSNCSSSTIKNLSTNLNDDNLDKIKVLKKQKIDNCLVDYTKLFERKSFVVLDNSYNEVIRDMVNSTAQHPKTRNSNVKEHITYNKINESISNMTMKSAPVIEVIDKHTKEISSDNQMTAEKPDRQTNYETVVHDSSGLSLRTRTISSTSVPTLLQKSTVSATSVRSNCCNSAVNVVPRPRGRPPKNVNRIAAKKLLKKNTSKHSEKTKTIDLTSTVIPTELTSSSLECLQEQLVNKSTDFDNTNDKINKEPSTDIASVIIDVSTNVTNLPLTSEVDENKECIVSCKKKNNTRKRKQSSDIGEIIADKCILNSGSSKKSLMPTNNEPVLSTSAYEQNIGDNVFGYGFLTGHDIESYKQHTDLNVSSISPAIFYGRTYWPVNWEYSAAALTSHIQKKVSKDTLRKIRLICNAGGQNTPLLKTSQTQKKYQTPIVPRRGSASKLTSSLASVEISNGVRHHPALTSPTAKRIGRPPGKSNKLLKAVVKSNCPRKSPRQHASTLAAIMSNKVINTEIGTQQLDKIIEMDVEPKDSLDAIGPCVLTPMPKHDEKPEIRHYRRRRQLDHQRGTIKSRQRRSITPTPPKLCAQQPISQRTPINGVAVDHEIVKLRTKHVDIIKRRARDEGVRTNYICQQLRKVQEVAEQNRRDLSQEVVQIDDAEQENGTAIILSSNCSEDFWSSLTMDNNHEPDNMCLQIMYEQTGDKRFLCTELTDETVKMYHQQRDLILAECSTNNNSNFMSGDLCADIISASNKRKKKRPNMTGWPKEKRKKTMITASSSMTRTVDINSDSDVDIIIKRQKAAEQQRLRRRRIKLEKQKLSKEKSVTPKATPKQPGRRPNTKNKTATYRRSKKLNSTPTSSNKVNEKKSKNKKRGQQRIQNKTETAAISPTMGVKKNCGRPKGSMGVRQKLKLQLLQQRQNQTSLSSEQQKENIGQPTTSGKLKCVISTRNNRMKLLTSSSSSENLSRKRTLTRTKKSTVAYNLSSSNLETLPSAVTVKGKPGKRRKLNQQGSIATRTLAWDVGRPKRYHHSRNTSAGVEEEFCFVGSQPFEQHYPGVGGSSHNTVLENNQDQKENTINV